MDSFLHFGPSKMEMVQFMQQYNTSRNSYIWIVATVVIVMQEGSAADANKWKSDRSVKPHSSGVKQQSSVKLQNTIGCKFEEVAFHLWEKAEVLSHKRGCTRFISEANLMH